jgi:hypothetical protein
MSREVESNLVAFGYDEWVAYILGLCFDLPVTPSLRFVSPELVPQLFWLYNILDERNRKARFTFVAGVLSVLRTITPSVSNAKIIYDLIYFIHETKPLEHRGMLECMVRDETFVDLDFGTDNLHLLLFKAYLNVESQAVKFLDDFLLHRISARRPYTIYLYVFYVAFWGEAHKALIAFKKCMSDSDWLGRPAATQEAFTALMDVVPQYLELQRMLELFIDNSSFKFRDADPIRAQREQLIEHIRRTSDPALALFAEDVIRGTLSNYLNRQMELEQLVNVPEINRLIVRYTRSFPQSAPTNANTDDVGKQIIDDTNEMLISDMEQ